MSFAKRINGYGPDGRRLYFKGGGGGGGGSTFYANQDKLLGVQADIAEAMYNDIYAPNAPKAVASLSAMVDEANSGALEAQAREQAAKDVGVALGTSAGDMMRTATGYGAYFDPTTGRGTDTVASWGLNAAKLRTGAMNQATAGANNQKWARNYDFYNALSGVPTQSAQSLGSAASGFGSMGNAERNADVANAQGYGQAGASFAHTLMKADGGLVRKPGVHLASGGAVPSMQKLQPWRNRPTTMQSYEAPGAIESMIAGAAPTLAAEGVKHGLKAAFLPTQAAAPVATATPVAVGAGTGATTAGAGVTGATASGAGVPGATVPAGATLGAELGTTAALGTEAAGATAAAAGEAGLMGSLGAAGSAAMAAAPWLLGAYAVGSALDLFADGGEVKARKDMTDGGRVNGPGTETSDDIPAWLSDGEYVLNAEAVKTVGKKKLDAINEAGLRRRGGEATAGVKGGVPALAGGGMLGVALGAGVNQWDKLEAARRAEEDAKFNQGIATERMALAKAADKRATESHDLQTGALRRAEADELAARTSLGELRAAAQAVLDGKDSGDMWQGMLQEYNGNQGAFADGRTLYPQSTPQGVVLNTVGPNGVSLGSAPFDRNTKLKMLEEYYDRKMAYGTPAQYQAYQALKRQAEQAGIAHTRKLAEIAAQGEYQLAVAGLQDRGATTRNNNTVAAERERLGWAMNPKNPANVLHGQQADAARLANLATLGGLNAPPPPPKVHWTPAGDGLLVDDYGRVFDAAAEAALVANSQNLPPRKPAAGLARSGAAR